MINTCTAATRKLEQKSPLDEIGGEPLADSGFEQETPEPDFSGEQPDQQ